MGYCKTTETLVFSLFLTALFFINQAGAFEGMPCNSDYDCGAVTTLCLHYSGHRPGFECDVNSAKPCSSYCSAALKKCYCGYSPTGLCVSPSQCSTGSDAATQLSCSVSGKSGVVHTCYCPSCGNTLTYCKTQEVEKAKPTAAPAQSATPTPSAKEGKAPEAKTRSGYCGDRVCEAGEEWCAIDCLSPYGAFCTLSAYPKHVSLHGTSEITVRYFNVFYPVGFAAVNCGNSLVMYAWNCGGRTGECFTSCRYNYPGVYTVTAFAGGVSCRPTQVIAGQLPKPSPTPSPSPTPKPTVSPTPRFPRCVVETNPEYVYGSGTSNIKIPYRDLEQKPEQATIICGNGEIVYARCEGVAAFGNCVASCEYAAPPRYPWAYRVDAVVGGVQCTAGTVSLLAPSPTPTVTSTPHPTKGALVVKVFREDGIRPLWGAIVRVPGRGDFRTGFEGIVEVSDLDEGQYSLTVSAEGFETQIVDARVRGGETTQLSIVMREALGASCFVHAEPTQLKEGEATKVSVSYYSLPAVPESVRVDCGNGLATRAQCSGGASGNCVGGSCVYYNTGQYRLSATTAGVTCASASVSVSRPAPGKGALLVRVTDCASGSAVRGAKVELLKQTVPRPTPQGVYYTNEFGEVLASDLLAGDYVGNVSKEGFEAQHASARVEEGRTSTLAVCLERVARASCMVSITPNVLKINEAGVVSINYYSLPAEPESVRVDCGNGASTNAQCNGVGGTGICVGGSCSYSQIGVYHLTASAAGVACNQATARVTERGRNALFLQALETEKYANGGEKTCFALLLRNSGESRGVVELDAIASPSNDWKTSFSSKKFVVAPREIKNIDFCVEVPEAASGSYAYSINVRSEINDASTSVNLRALGASDYSLDYYGCFSVEANSGWVTRVLRVTNNAIDGNYEVELGASEIAVEADGVYAFKKGETREIPLRFSTEGLENKKYYFSLKLKRKLSGGGTAVAFERMLCVRPTGAATSAVTLSPSSLVVARGATQTATVRVKNTGSGSTRFYVSALKKPGISITVNPQYLTLDAGSEGTSEISVTADADAALGSIAMPVRVYAGSGGYYSGFEAGFDCGNGETKTVQCGHGDGSCSASCVFESAGSYTPTANLAGNACSTQVRVVDYYPANSLVLRAETPFIANSGSSTIRIDYYSLGSTGGGSNAPVISNVEVEAYATNATIYWDTDKNANSRIDFVLANSNAVHRISQSDYVTQHQVTLTGLTPNSTYFFNVTSCDMDGRCTTDANYYFETESGLSFSGAPHREKTKNDLNEWLFDDSHLIRVDCGNGQTQTASCSGATGSCSVSCYYSSSGTYSVSASVDGVTPSPSVYGTRVVVGRSDVQACFLTSYPQTIRYGDSATLKMNYFNIPSSWYYGGEYDGLVDSQTLLVTIVAAQPTPQSAGALTSPRLEIDAKTIRAAPGTRTATPITIRNKNYYALPAVLVYAAQLPNGVTAKTLSPFPLAAGEEKTIALEFELGDVAQGDYEIEIRAESAVAKAPAKRVKLEVRGVIGEAAVSVSEATTSVHRNEESKRFEITLNFTVKNEANTRKTLTAALEGLPANWTYGITPLAGATLAANESKAFSAVIFAPLAAFDENREYPATLAVSDEGGKTKRVPLVINKGGASILAGFFTALGGDYGLFALLIIVIAVGAALLYLAGVKTKQAEAVKQTAKQEKHRRLNPVDGKGEESEK
ncbi:MAG: hypothetical protein QW343_01205 [Candidatus Norongarragalinales archaeon]